MVVFKGPGEVWNVFPYHLKVTKENARIIWITLDGSSFDRDQSPFSLKQGESGQFSDGSPTDDISDAPSPKPKGKNYSVRFANEAGHNSDIKYNLTFKDAAGNPVTCDPLINNSGLGDD